MHRHVRQHAQGPYVSVSYGIFKLKEKWIYALILYLEAISSGQPPAKMKIQFPLRESHWGNKYLREGCVLRGRWPTENAINGIFEGSLSHNVMPGLSF